MKSMKLFIVRYDCFFPSCDTTNQSNLITIITGKAVFVTRGINGKKVSGEIIHFL